jgi:hypothetical protein
MRGEPWLVFLVVETLLVGTSYFGSQRILRFKGDIGEAAACFGIALLVALVIFVVGMVVIVKKHGKGWVSAFRARMRSAPAPEPPAVTQRKPYTRAELMRMKYDRVWRQYQAGTKEAQ